MARDFELDTQAAKKRCEADFPTMAGYRYLTAKGRAFIKQLRADCATALEALEEAQEALRAVRERAKQGRKIMERDIYLFAGDILTILGESE